MAGGIGGIEDGPEVGIDQNGMFVGPNTSSEGGSTDPITAIPVVWVGAVGGGITASWLAVENADAYRLYRNGALIADTALLLFTETDYDGPIVGLIYTVIPYNTGGVGPPGTATTFAGFLMVSMPLRLTDAEGTGLGGPGAGRITFNVGDTAPDRRVQVVDSNNRPIDLTGATAIYQLAQKGGTFPDDGAKTITRAAIVEPGSGGYLRFDLKAGDTDVPGLYYETWRIAFADGSVITVPGNGNLIVEIRDI